MYLIKILRLRYTSDLKDRYIDDFEDQSRLIGWENWLLIYWTYDLWYQILWYGLSIWCSWWLLRLWVDGSVTDIFMVLMDEILIDSRWDCIVKYQCSDMLLYYLMLLKITEKSLLDRTLCTILLFIVYTVTAIVYCHCYYLSCIRFLFTVILYCYCHCIILVI